MQVKSRQFFMQKILEKYNYNFNALHQVGGAKRIESKYKGFTFIVEETLLESVIYINIMPTPKDCGSIWIDKDDRIGILQNFGANAKCAKEGLPDSGTGIIQMKFIIRYLKENKDRLHIDTLQLSDDSYITCKNAKIPLADLYMITHGNTWYNFCSCKNFTTNLALSRLCQSSNGATRIIAK